MEGKQITINIEDTKVAPIAAAVAGEHTSGAIAAVARPTIDTRAFGSLKPG